MFKFWFVLRFIVSIILLGLLVAGGIALFHAGWAQGMMAAASTSTAAGSTVAPHYWMHPYGAYPGMFGFGMGLIPAIILIVLVLLGIRLLFFRPFMGHGFHGRDFGHCGPYGHFHHHMGPPTPEQYNKWYQEWEKYNQTENNPGEKPDGTPKSGE